MNAPTLHLIDLDNLVGGPSNEDLVEASLAELLEAASYEPGDHVVIAAEATLAKTAFFGIPVPARKLVGRGPDGADTALISYLSPVHIEARYSRLVVASGDGGFADLVGRVQRIRSMVEVYGRPRAIARSLKRAARYCELTDLHDVIQLIRGGTPATS
jgi:hypothetical protein